VHRLDRDTSGCLIVAKNRIFLKEINKKLKNNSVTKIYSVLVQGYWPDELREVNAPLEKNYLESGERMVRVSPDGKKAVTHFRVVQHFQRMATLLEARLETGRTHQIRVHCRHAGHPIIGDQKYGSRRLAEPLKGVDRLCLHAASVAFNYPGDGPLHEFHAALDQDLIAVLNLLRSK